MTQLKICIGSKIELTISTIHMTLFHYRIKWIRMSIPLGISKFLNFFGIFGVHNNFGCHQNLIQEKMYFETYLTMITSVFCYFRQSSA